MNKVYIFLWTFTIFKIFTIIIRKDYKRKRRKKISLTSFPVSSSALPTVKYSR